MAQGQFKHSGMNSKIEFETPLLFQIMRINQSESIQMKVQAIDDFKAMLSFHASLESGATRKYLENQAQIEAETNKRLDLAKVGNEVPQEEYSRIIRDKYQAIYANLIVLMGNVGYFGKVALVYTENKQGEQTVEATLQDDETLDAMSEEDAVEAPNAG